MLKGTAVESAEGTEVEEAFWTVALLLAMSEELIVASLADGEKEVDSVCRSLSAVELDSVCRSLAVVELASLDEVDDDSVEV